jgi:hypothetical protein
VVLEIFWIELLFPPTAGAQKLSSGYAAAGSTGLLTQKQQTPLDKHINLIYHTKS